MSRYSETTGTGPQVATGWQLSHLAPPSGLFGANGMQFGPDGRLYVVQAFGSQVSAHTADGQTRIIADNVPGANGLTAYQDRLFMDECRPGGRLFEVYPDGRAPRLLAADLPLPNALSVGPDGQLYFPEIAVGEIWRVPLTGGAPQRFLAG